MKRIFLIVLLCVSLSHFVSAQNVGIGTNMPLYKLDVAGNFHTTGSMQVDSNATITGDILSNNVKATGVVNAGSDVNATGNVTAGGNVNAAGDVTAHGGGVLYNTVYPSAANLKVYYRTVSFTITNLAPHSVSVAGAVGIGGGFTQPPMVFVGDIVSNAGEVSYPAGPLYQLQLVTYASQTGQFSIRILNTSNSAISQTVTWNIMCIGQ